MKIIVATGNTHKVEEFSKIVTTDSISLLAADRTLDVIEDGDTFSQNSFLKAKAYFDEFKTPVLSDDSGLLVKALPEELGIHTARFGGENLTSTQRNDLLLKRLNELGDKSDRSAMFVAVLCLYVTDQEVFFFEGKVEGQIGIKPQGIEGFGYDPIFFPNAFEGKKSMAEVNDWKNSNSHRAQAFKYLEQFLIKSGRA